MTDHADLAKLPAAAVAVVVAAAAVGPRPEPMLHSWMRSGLRVHPAQLRQPPKQPRYTECRHWTARYCHHHFPPKLDFAGVSWPALQPRPVGSRPGARTGQPRQRLLRVG